MEQVESFRKIREEVKALLVKVANISHKTATQIENDEPLFQDGLGLDSIDALELAVELDKRYSLKIKNNEAGLAVLQNVNTIAQAIFQTKSGGSFSSAEENLV